MKKSLLIFALLLISYPFNAQAEGTFIGVDLSNTKYPEWGGKIKSKAYADGALYAYADDGWIASETILTGMGIHGGQWLNSNFGWEIGYDNLGRDRGDINVLQGFSSQSLFGNFRYSATASHAAAMGGLKVGKSTLFGKLGMHSHSTRLVGVAPLSGASYSESASGTGLLFGIGLVSPYTEKLSGRFTLDVFKDVVFTDIIDFSKTTQEDLIKFSYGLDYAF